MLSKNGKEFGKYCAVHWRCAHRQETVKLLHVIDIGLSSDSEWPYWLGYLYPTDFTLQAVVGAAAWPMLQQLANQLEEPVPVDDHRGSSSVQVEHAQRGPEHVLYIAWLTKLDWDRLMDLFKEMGGMASNPGESACHATK